MIFKDFLKFGTVEGQSFGKYTLLRQIASGGMADIYLARQAGAEGFAKDITIKKIKEQFTKKKSFVKMFQNEAKLAALLSHPNICQIFDLGQVGDSYFIAMEYIQGRDMNRIVNVSNRAGIPFPMEYALKIASNCCEGLYYAHTKTDSSGNPLNIVHRDVTPENIMVSFDGGVKILDFGIAKAGTLFDSEKPGEVRGKLSFLSPEAVRIKDVDHRADIFSLGAVLYEWITGYRLFTGESDESIMRSIVEGKINPPSYFKPDTPRQVETILMKALEKDREKRYQNAWDMQYDIDTFLTQHEFTPSNVHLANFLKQLFKEELDNERKTTPHEGAGTPLPPPVPHVAQPQPAVHAHASSNGSQTVSVKVSNEDMAQLNELSRKHGVPLDKLFSEIVKMYLRYR